MKLSHWWPQYLMVVAFSLWACEAWSNNERVFASWLLFWALINAGIIHYQKKQQRYLDSEERKWDDF